MANLETRQKILASGFKYHEIAKEIGISSSMFSIWFRSELTEEQIARINGAIERLQAKRNALYRTTV